MTKVVTRFAPSPTGKAHLGSIHAALLNYAYAKQHEGTYILRIEDTDKERSATEHEEYLLAALKWVNLSHDAIYRQSDRTSIYRKYLEELVARNIAYVSKEEIKNEGDRPEVIRFRNPNRVVTFDDIIRGQISVDTTDLGDFVIAKDIETPVFHFSNVVDDFEMGVTHIIRGEEHLSNTPRQILIREAIAPDYKPQYAHYPLALAPDRSKLSKRHGAMDVLSYRDQGYLAESLLNFVALWGWSPQAKRGANAGEVISPEEFLELFDLKDVQRAAAIVDTTKLDWLNREHMKRLPKDELSRRAGEYAKYLPILFDRINKFADIPKLLELDGEFDFLLQPPTYSKELLIGKSGASEVEIKKHLNFILSNGLDREVVWPYAEKEGRGKVLWPMRVALSGKEKSPDPFTLVKYLGNEESSRRIRSAFDML